MQFPNTLDEFIEQYSFVDKERIYTNGSELIPTFRIKQWEEHQERNNYKELYEKEKGNWNELKEWLEDNWKQSQDVWFVKIINKMQEIERL